LIINLEIQMTDWEKLDLNLAKSCETLWCFYIIGGTERNNLYLQTPNVISLMSYQLFHLRFIFLKT